MEKVYAVYSIPKSPEYRLEKIFRTKEGAKNWIKKMKDFDIQRIKLNQKKFSICNPESQIEVELMSNNIYDIQIEEVFE